MAQLDGMMDYKNQIFAFLSIYFIREFKKNHALSYKKMVRNFAASEMQNCTITENEWLEIYNKIAK